MLITLIPFVPFVQKTNWKAYDARNEEEPSQGRPEEKIDELVRGVPSAEDYNVGAVETGKSVVAMRRNELQNVFGRLQVVEKRVSAGRSGTLWATNNNFNVFSYLLVCVVLIIFGPNKQLVYRCRSNFAKRYLQNKVIKQSSDARISNKSATNNW